MSIYRLTAALFAAAFGTTSAFGDTSDPILVHWPDLRQQSEPFSSRQSGVDDTRQGSYLNPLSGQRIRLAGYMLPVDREGDFVYAFLLTQVAGACIHTPSPPPDQLVLVTLKKPFKANGI
jgi:hypothetical protein